MQRQGLLDEQSALLTQQQADLDEQAALVAQQQDDLDKQAALVLSQQSELEKQNSLMLQQQAALEEQETLMAQQQQKIEQIIGIKADLIADLKQEFDQHNLGVTIDETDGSIALDSNVLSAEGNTMLSQVLPIYCKVLVAEKYQDYLAEVRIDGYTDTSGDYLYNLQLSQERALAVANYLFGNANDFLSEQELGKLREKVTANGHSMSNPVLDENGQIDMDASRRVEIKFSLKDEEMINELKQIMDYTASTEAPAAQ